jgi:hypothetical protein
MSAEPLRTVEEFIEQEFAPNSRPSKRAGTKAQALLGHEHASTTQGYLQRHEPQWVDVDSL